MSTLTAHEAAVLDCPGQTRPSSAPIVSEKRHPVTIEQGSYSGWRGYLEHLGVEAAIILCDLRGPDGGRHMYMVGFDEAKTNTQLSEGLLAYAESVWRVVGHGAFHTFPLSASPAANDEERSAFPALARFDGVALNRALAGFSHVAVMHGQSGADTTSAVLFRSAGPFGEPLERQLRDVLPLFHDAALSEARSSKSEHRAALLTAMFDQVSLATLLVNANGRPVFANEVARRMLSERRFLLQSADGTIACVDSNQTRALRAAVRAAATTDRDAGDEISMRVGEPEGDWRLAVVVPANTAVGNQHLRCAMILIHTPQRMQAPGHVLRALGLLPSEQRFLEAFLQTSSLSEAAQSSGLSEETARTYLKRVRGKLGVHRQLELARLIYGLVPPIRAVEAQAAE